MYYDFLKITANKFEFLNFSRVFNFLLNGIQEKEIIFSEKIFSDDI